MALPFAAPILIVYLLLAWASMSDTAARGESGRGISIFGWRIEAPPHVSASGGPDAAKPLAARTNGEWVCAASKAAPALTGFTTEE